MSVEPDLEPRTPDEQFVRRLAGMHHSRDGALSGVRRWLPGALDAQQIIDISRVTQGADPDDYQARAVVARCFAIFHSGTGAVSYGFTGSSVGRALRSLGSVGAGQGFGPKNPATERLLKQIVEAETLSDFTELLSRAVTGLRSAGSAPPHWATLLADVRDWNAPTSQSDVRLRWAQAFYTTPEKKAK